MDPPNFVKSGKKSTERLRKRSYSRLTVLRSASVMINGHSISPGWGSVCCSWCDIDVHGARSAYSADSFVQISRGNLLSFYSSVASNKQPYHINVYCFLYSPICVFVTCWMVDIRMNWDSAPNHDCCSNCFSYWCSNWCSNYCSNWSIELMLQTDAPANWCSKLMLQLIKLNWCSKLMLQTDAPTTAPTGAPTASPTTSKHWYFHGSIDAILHNNTRFDLFILDLTAYKSLRLRRLKCYASISIELHETSV